MNIWEKKMFHSLPLSFSVVKNEKWHYSTYRADSDDKTDYQTERGNNPQNSP